MKDSIYFSHDADARNDEKIIGLIMEHGYEGYGIFWAIVEMLRTATDYKMQLNCKRIAFALHTDDAKINSIISDFGLFESDDISFWSESLNRRMEKKNIISDARRKAAKKRWDSASAMQMHSKSNANEMQLQCNKGKEKKQIKETNKESTNEKQKPATLSTAKTYLERNNISFVPQDVWEEWCEHKKKFRCALTDRAMGMNISEIENIDKAKAEYLLTTAMSRGWKAVYNPDKNGYKNTTQHVPKMKNNLTPIWED